MSENIEIVLPDGTKISGTSAKVEKLLKSLGYEPQTFLNSKGIYYSASKRKFIPISTMATPHLRNAISLHYAKWLEGLKTLSNKDFLRALHNGPEDLSVLVVELARRKDE